MYNGLIIIIVISRNVDIENQLKIKNQVFISLL